MATITNPGVPVPVSDGRTLYVKAMTINSMEALDMWGREYWSDPSYTILGSQGVPGLTNVAGMRQVAELHTGSDVGELEMDDLVAIFSAWMKANKMDQANIAAKKKAAEAQLKTTTQPLS